MQRTFVLFLRICFCLVVLLSLGLYPQSSPQAQVEEYCTAAHQDVSAPLNDLGNSVYIRMDGQITGFTGGLYPNGSNVRPAAHEAAGVNLAGQIMPLNASGFPSTDGKIVMVSVGMSNAFMEFGAFITLAGSDPALNPSLVLVNGAQPGMTAETWVDPNATTWTTLNRRLTLSGVTPSQVQVAWVKQTRTGSGDFPDKALILQDDLKAIVRNLKAKYPNIKIAYLSSRTRSYQYWSGLSPEPAAFETGFAVKWLIESQINGDPDLNYDPVRGPVVAPYLSWGAHLWIDGLNPRSDGLTWPQQDLVIDCVHPSTYGQAKVAQQLMSFFKNDTTAGWFQGVIGVDIFLNFLPRIFR